MKKYLILIFASITNLAFAVDTDGDGLADNIEVEIGTSTTLKDTDGDGGSDNDELRIQCDPTNPNHKIVKIGEWDKTGQAINFSSRTVTLSLDGKIVEEKQRFNDNFFPIDMNPMYTKLKQRKSFRLSDEAAKKTIDEKEKYIALSPKYEEIKKLRAESSRLMKIYFANQTKENLEAWNKVRIQMVEMQNKEYEEAKSAAAYYSKPKNKVEKLEERIEELEEKIDDLEDQ